MPDMSMNYKWTRRPLQMTGRCRPTNQKATSQSFGEHFQNLDTTEHSVRQRLDHLAKSGTLNLSHRTSVRAGAMFCLANRTGACVVVAAQEGHQHAATFLNMRTLSCKYKYSQVVSKSNHAQNRQTSFKVILTNPKSLGKGFAGVETSGVSARANKTQTHALTLLAQALTMDLRCQPRKRKPGVLA